MLGFEPFPCKSKTHPQDSASLPAAALSAQTGTASRWEQSWSLDARRHTHEINSHTRQ